MITDYLVEHHALVPIAGLLIAALCLALGTFIVASAERGPLVARVLLATALVPIVALTLLPTSGQPSAGCAAQFIFPSWGAVEALSNVALFLPAALFASLVSGRPLLTIATGSLLSVALETIQALLPAIGRACDTGDWMMNTGGVLAGVALSWVATRLGGRWRRQAG